MSLGVRISSILARKGCAVHTVAVGDTVRHAVHLLERLDIGALVVTDGERCAGILSERDVVRHLAAEDGDGLDTPVARIMTADVHTCGPDRTTSEVMQLMTRRRIRHVPVLGDDGLIGLVSIRDVVESYVDELEVAAEALTEYVTGSAY